MILKPLGHNYIKSSAPLGQPIQRKALGQSVSPLGTSPLPSIANVEESEMMVDWSYFPRYEWEMGNGEQNSITPLQARQDPSFPTSQTTDEDIVSQSNNISEIVTPEVQRSPVNSPTLSTPQTFNEDIVLHNNNISEITISEVKRLLSEESSLSSPQTTREDIVSNSNKISESETPEVQRSPSDTPLSELPGYQDVYSEDNLQSSPKFSLNKFASNTIDKATPVARKIIQRVQEITSPKSDNFSSSESVQPKEQSLEIGTPEVQRSPVNSPTLSTPQTSQENIVSQGNNIEESTISKVQRSLSEESPLSSPQTTHEDIVSNSNNLVENITPEVQRSLSDIPLAELPGYQDVYSENNIQSRPKFSLSKFTSNAIDNTLPIARKVIQRVSEIASPKPSNLSSSESIQPQEESLETPTPEVQRSPSDTPPLSTPQTTHQYIVSESNNIVESRTPEVQRSPSDTPPLSTPQTTHQYIVSESNNIVENITPEVQRSPSDTPPLSTPQTTHQYIISESNNIVESRTPEIQRSPSDTPPLSTPQTTHQYIVSESNNIVESRTPEIQRSPSEISPISTQTDTAIATEESKVTTLSEGQGFLQLQPLGQSQPLARDSDYLPSSFVSTSLKEILDYSGKGNPSPSSIQKKEDTERETLPTSVSSSEPLDFPKSWSNVSELINNSPNEPDSGEAENWGGFTGLMRDTSLLPESSPANNAILQTKNAPIEGELLLPISFEEIEAEKGPSLPPSPQILEQLSNIEQPIEEEELEFLAQLVYRLLRSRLNIEREQQYNQLGGASFWLDTVYFARDEKSSLSSTAMLAILETVNPYTSDRLAMLAREVYVLLQMRIECDRDRQGHYY